MATIRFKRGTLAELDLAAQNRELLAGEPYFLTDTGGIAIGLSNATYKLFSDAEHNHSIGEITNLAYIIAGKQELLINQLNIKSINGESILGSGDMTITGTGGGGSDPTAEALSGWDDTDGTIHNIDFRRSPLEFEYLGRL